MDTHNSDLCIHCDAALTSRDLAEGWCDTCGKRIPTSALPKTATAPVPVAPPSGGTRWLLALGGVVIAALGVAAAVAATH